MIRRPPRSTLSSSSAASDVYKRQLEARDLLFARLLQYRAFKEVAAGIGARLAEQARSLPRQVGLEPHLAALLPELVLRIGPDQLALLAARAMQPRPDKPGVDLGHIYTAVVSVREQAAVLVDRLRRGGSGTFRSLVHDATSTGMVLPGSWHCWSCSGRASSRSTR